MAHLSEHILYSWNETWRDCVVPDSAISTRTPEGS